MTLVEFFSNPSKWTQEVYARDDEGRPVDLTTDKAVCWCTLGGIYRVYGYDNTIARRIEDKIRRVIAKREGRSNAGWVSISEWQDRSNQTYEEVMSVLKEADV